MRNGFGPVSALMDGLLSSQNALTELTVVGSSVIPPWSACCTCQAVWTLNTSIIVPSYFSQACEILLFLSVPSAIFSTNADLIKTENCMQVNKAIVYSCLCIHIHVFAYIIYPVITNSTNISQWNINLISYNLI